MTVFSDLQPGGVTEYLIANQRPPINFGKYGGYIGAALVGLLALLYWIGSSIVDRIRRGRETVVVQYESPDKLGPGEIGLLTDNRTGMTEVTATIIDLAVRGYLRIEQTKSPGLLSEGKYIIHKLKAADAKMADYEKGLFNALFATGKDVKLDELDKTKMASAVSSFQSKLKEQLKAKGYFAPSGRRRVGPFLLFGLAALVAAVVVPWASGASLEEIPGQPGAMVGGLALFAVPWFRRRFSKEGMTEWPRSKASSDSSR